MAVKSSIEGRAPVTVRGGWVACGDRNGWTVKVHKNDGGKYPKVASLEVSVAETEDDFDLKTTLTF